jgi:hemolysin-activating ACP:hemolysin acyltransferase
LEVGFDAVEAAKINAETLGFVARLIADSPAASMRSFEYIKQVVLPAISASQLKVYFNRRGQPVGFVIWAWLGTDTEREFMSGGWRSLHHSEWREGNSLWLLDIVSPFNNTRHILRAFYRDNMPGVKELTYGRRIRGSFVVKRISIE